MFEAGFDRIDVPRNNFHAATIAGWKKLASVIDLSAAESGSACALYDSHNVQNDILGNFEHLQGFGQIFGNGIEMLVLKIKCLCVFSMSCRL
jgi:hypothetical protein